MNKIIIAAVITLAIYGLVVGLQSINGKINTYDRNKESSQKQETLYTPLPTLEAGNPLSYIKIHDVNRRMNGISRNTTVTGYLTTTAIYYSYTEIVLETKYYDGNKSVVGTQRNTINSRLFEGRRVPFEMIHKLPRRTDSYSVNVIDAKSIKR